MPSKTKKSLKEADVFAGLASGLKSAVIKPTIHGYTPHSKQIIFHSSTARGRQFIGGNRSGKTEGSVAEAVFWAEGESPFQNLRPAPTRGRVVGVDFINGINQIIKPKFARLLPPSLLLNGSWEDSYSSYDKELTLTNGSTIQFMSYEQEVEKFAGTDQDWIYFDEEPPQDIFLENNMRLIDRGGKWWMAMTPVEGMTWTYDDVYLKARTDTNYFVVEVDTTDNPYVSEIEIIAALGALTEDEKAARLRGQYVQRGGLIYKMFNPNVHIIDPMVPPLDWLWVAGMDHGFNNPTAWLWAAINRDGTVIIFDEHYASGKIVAWHAEKVLEKNAGYKRTPEYNVGDPSIRNTDPLTGTSVQLEYIEHGVPITLGNNDVRAGLNRVARYFEGTQTPEGPKPKLYITRNCVNLIHEIGRYSWGEWAQKTVRREKNKKEEPKKKDDHACDAMRYLISSRPEQADDGTHIPEFSYKGMANEAVDLDNPPVAIGPRPRSHQDYHLGSEY